MDDLRKKIVVLIKRLKVASQKGTVNWEEGAYGDSFITATEMGSVRVGFDEESGHYLRLLDDDGEMVDQFWGPEFDELNEYSHGELAELFTLARRRAKDSESLVEYFLEHFSPSRVAETEKRLKRREARKKKGAS